jgi:hypothetical protein
MKTQKVKTTMFYFNETARFDQNNAVLTKQKQKRRKPTTYRLVTVHHPLPFYLKRLLGCLPF